MPLNFLGFLNLTLTDILDIMMVAAIIYVVFRWIRGSSAMNIFTAIILLYLVKVIVSSLNMTLMSGIMDTVLDVGVLALIVIFQPEIRHFLTRMGSRYGLRGGRLQKFFGRKTGAMGGESASELLEAVKVMAEEKVSEATLSAA